MANGAVLKHIHLFFWSRMLRELLTHQSICGIHRNSGLVTRLISLELQNVIGKRMEPAHHWCSTYADIPSKGTEVGRRSQTSLEDCGALKGKSLKSNLAGRA